MPRLIEPAALELNDRKGENAWTLYPFSPRHAQRLAKSARRDYPQLRVEVIPWKPNPPRDRGEAERPRT